MFTRSGNIWTLEATLGASDAEAFANFGLSVSLDGDRALIGAPYDTFAADTGFAYVYSRSGTVWVEQAKLIPSDGGTDDEFGFSVSLVR